MMQSKLVFSPVLPSQRQEQSLSRATQRCFRPQASFHSALLSSCLIYISSPHMNPDASLHTYSSSHYPSSTPFIRLFSCTQTQLIFRSHIEQIWQSLHRTFYRGGPILQSALSGIDIALWDLKARSLSLPLTSLLGGPVRSTLRVYAWIGGDRPSLSTLSTHASSRKSQGFTAVKMNATEDLGWLDSPSLLIESVERLKLVKKMGMDAGMDFHGRVHKPMAKQLATALEPHRPLFIEEPLLSENIEGIKALAQQTSIPIALGERLFSRWDVRPFLEAGCVDILQPDISHCGGISEMKRIAAMAETYDVALAPHCPLGPIALAACCAVDATVANFAIQEMGLGIHYNDGSQDLSSYIKNPEVWAVRDGYIDILKGPGLGIEVDEEMVRKLAKDAKAWISPTFEGPGGELREW
ncbi:enolase C-terminal domain-like protein [Lophiostoma macrostomum CBS 122681]|uniref:Enolase C-terminal domain-like protein n=1 Tax=Lophiostoma macrostomum CBS 122681 TaxID=1314788 RepID=A0A6A6TK04_9PLEO|nr:enolase C-terminal domain-like protein [Lophiostoma macrostomum CBS 122681]